MKKYYRAKLKDKPDLIGLARCFPDKFPALLASNTKNKHTGRYSLLFAASKKIIHAYNQKQLRKMFDKIDRPIQRSNGKEYPLPFYSGWFLYLSYGSIKAWENSLKDIQHPQKQALGIAIRCKSAVIIDHIEDRSYVVGQSKKQIKKLRKKIKKLTARKIHFKNHLSLQDDDVQAYIKNVERAKQYIRQGDVYQVNLARKWQVHSDKKIDGLELYTTLSQHNPAPFAGFFHSKNFSVISSSPERLVKVAHSIIESRPIAGTRPRHADKQKDQELIEELINHPKEQAEHIMLIDLERNDLGRVSEVGSVKVDEFMVVESYAKVHHIVSNVVGKLQKNSCFVDVIKATFPGGTITGCPKIRCMQIIDELESSARGAYTGSMGYLCHSGKMDLNILIRSFTLSHNTLSFHAGAGIVYDSIAENEAQESKHKAQALINSL